MSCTFIGIHERGDYILTQKGVNFSVVYHVESNNDTDDEADALAVVPNAMFDQLGSIESYVISRSAKKTSNDGRTFHCVVTWGQPDKPENDVPPWEREHKPNWDFTECQVNIIKDINGDLTMNSAKDPYKGIDVDRPRLTFTNSVNYAIGDWSPSTAVAYDNAINASAWNSGAEATWKVKFKISKPWEQKWGYWWQVDYSFNYNPLTWDVIVLDEGLNQIVSSKKVPIIKGATPISEPRALNGSGVALAEGSTSFVYNTFEVYNRMDFSIFPTS